MNENINKVSLSGIRLFTERYRDDEDMLFMTIGEPDFNTPEEVKQAAKQALDANDTHYPAALGNLSLRKKIAKFEKWQNQTNYNYENVVVTAGATQGLSLSLWSLLNPNDEVLIPIPSFPLYQSQVILGGAKPVLMDTSLDRFQITLENLESHITNKTRVLIITSPNNPTGTVLNNSSISAIYQAMKKYPSLYVILDEVYRSLVFDSKYPSLHKYEEIRERIIVVQSFSKSHAMTGWRIGYILASKNIIEGMHRFHQNMMTGVSTISQRAAEKALELSPEKMRASFKRRAEYVQSRLEGMSIPFVPAQGGLYVFFSIKEFLMTSIEFAEQLALKEKVVLVPGIYFGSEGYVRLSFGLDIQKLKEGLDRLERFVASLRSS